ncbi:MAG: PIN domain nuclease [Streptococcaceae bacterium]|nr:PIN domain nuclease [Streptococcaceae bacterium]
MIRKGITLLMIILGASFGNFFLPFFWNLSGQTKNHLLNNSFANGSIGAIIFFLFSLFFAGLIERIVQTIDNYLLKISLKIILPITISMGLGLLVGGLISIPLFLLKIPILDSALPIIIMVGTSYIGFRIGLTHREEFFKIFNKKKEIKVEENQPGEGEILERKVGENYHKFKILDTSTIIDGRIYDIVKTGFLEGTILIPNFVLFELQYIADSADSLRRVRGRRGLDILNSLQQEDDITLEMYDGDFESIKEVDTKLLKLAKMLDGVVVTNDYNLNKVAEFQNIPILNINELANAVKPVAIPGETMKVSVVKEGSEHEQGVAYLDDGTMIVVEDGKHFMNEEIKVVVTSVLQTAAGRMIFARPNHARRGIPDIKNKE